MPLKPQHNTTPCGPQDFHTPRISFSFGCSGVAEGWEPAYLRRDAHLPFPRVAARAALASAQLIVYHERFQLDRRQLLLYHDTYTRSRELFSANYQKEVITCACVFEGGSGGNFPGGLGGERPPPVGKPSRGEWYH